MKFYCLLYKERVEMRLEYDRLFYLNIMEEIWKSVKGYEGYYEVSSFGNVRRVTRLVNCLSNSLRTVKERIIKQRVNPEGRYYVTLCKEGRKETFKTHRLVAMAFLNHIPCGYKLVVDHINNNPLDNRVENLQIITSRENVSKDRKNKTSKYRGVWFCKTNNVWKSEIKIGGKRFNLGRFLVEEEARDAYLRKLEEHETTETI